ncbi:hypothetical protein [Phyllobacterium sp. YR531]|uniref:hypothetical protein n=1 Tax=Phyllobacterium sp. YR531 TaxID=1144343 RepID=UPI0002DAA7FC|nr:hypothetical protein [Phyllobacterium sp. YR531]
MPFRNNIYANKYSSRDWDVMAQAYELAIRQIGGKPLIRRERLARCVMTFFDRGVQNPSQLSSLAMSRELSLVDIERTRGAPLREDEIAAADNGFFLSGANGNWKDSTTN